MAGYFATPLPRKLGIKPAHRVALLGRASEVDLGALPERVELRATLRGAKPFDLILFLTDKESAMASKAPALASRLTPAGMLWLGWPKKASGAPTDLSDARVRAIGLATGLVDNKTCAIDDIWSGLRFVRRRKDR